jgi:hypothetical protein
MFDKKGLASVHTSKVIPYNPDLYNMCPNDLENVAERRITLHHICERFNPCMEERSDHPKEVPRAKEFI